MDELGDGHSTADNPLEMRQEEAQRMIGWLLQLRRRFLHHHSNTDRREATIACLGEVLQFMGHDRVLHPLLSRLAELDHALEDGTLGSLTPYLKPKPTPPVDGPLPVGGRGRPPRDSTRRLHGTAAFFVETLVKNDAFSCSEAAAMVAGALRDAGHRYENNTVTDWHEHVVHQAKRGELDRKVCDALELDLKQRHPEHAGWDRAQLTVWLNETARRVPGWGLKNFGR